MCECKKPRSSCLELCSTGLSKSNTMPLNCNRAWVRRAQCGRPLKAKIQQGCCNSLPWGSPVDLRGLGNNGSSPYDSQARTAAVPIPGICPLRSAWARCERPGWLPAMSHRSPLSLRGRRPKRLTPVQPFPRHQSPLTPLWLKSGLLEAPGKAPRSVLTNSS